MGFRPKTTSAAQVPSPRARARSLQSNIEQAPASAETAKPVGYGNPPVHSRFKPGQSGNPKGRPRGAKGMNTLVRGLLTEKVTVRTNAGPKRMSKMEAALHKLTEKAFGGDGRALEALIRLYRDSVPEELVAKGDTAASPDKAANDDAALYALYEIIRDEVRGRTEAGQ